MTSPTELVEPQPVDARDAMAALAFEAPYVVERLVRDRVVDSVPEAERLFAEVKRYLVLVDANRDALVGMYSARVDEAWHAFILYTAQYEAFCRQFFGRFLAHAPQNAPAAAGRRHQRAELTFPEFLARYEATFGESLPDVWYDAKHITPAQRMFSDMAGKVTVVLRDASVQLCDATGDVVMTVSHVAAPALDFMARTGAFHVRELPGGLTDDERVTLVGALFSLKLLRIAP